MGSMVALGIVNNSDRYVLDLKQEFIIQRSISFNNPMLYARVLGVTEEPIRIKERRLPLPPHWYFITIECCPICGLTEEVRERILGPKPQDPEARREYIESYCGCL